MTPAWYWPWVRWRLGEGEFKGDAMNPQRRPSGVPTRIPSWAWEKYLAFLARRRSALPATSVTKEHPSLAFWRRMSMWVTRIDHFPVEYCVSYGHGEYPIVVVPTLRGRVMEDNLDGLAQYVKRLQASGFKVAGSQWGEAFDGQEAEVEASWAAEAINDFGFDAWVMNGEKVYEGGGKSLLYTRRFRTHFPELPFGWSPEPRLALDHRFLQANGVCYMPQAYPLENKWDVAMCVQVAVEQFGYDVKNVHPLIQAYPNPAGERYPAVNYRDQARKAGVPALCLYTANQSADVPQYWRDLVV